MKIQKIKVLPEETISILEDKLAVLSAGFSESHGGCFAEEIEAEISSIRNANFSANKMAGRATVKTGTEYLNSNLSNNVHDQEERLLTRRTKLDSKIS